MHIPTHLLSGWCVANCFRLTPRQRLLAMVAAAIPDVDGLGFFISQEAYWDYHHVLGHNLPFGILASAVLAAFSSPGRLKSFLLYLALFHLHLLMDFYGSGPGWAIAYLWPFSHHAWKTSAAWPLTSWQNILAFLVLLAWTVAIAFRRGRTPLELIAPRLDKQLLGVVDKQ